MATGTVNLGEALRTEYQQLFDTCQVTQSKAQEVEGLVGTLLKNRARYESVGTPLGVPWNMVAVAHNMEGSQNFKTHLHNGDPLGSRTTHVPAGRPALGTPPFTWEQSATDALQLKKLDLWEDWTIPGLLYCLERYNGWGYRLYHPEVKSPYLWSGSNQYVAGKYVKDGTWSATAVSAQCGAAVLLRRMAEKGAMESESHVPDEDLATAMKGKAALFRYSPKAVAAGGTDLQKFLNGFPGIFLKEDGKLGQRTSDAYKRIFGRYLLGDPRG